MSSLDLMRRCSLWIQETYGDASLFDPVNRGARFVEEAVELAQACGVPKSQAQKILDRAYERPVGTVPQEIAGSYFTLLGLCYALSARHGMTYLPEELCEAELWRVRHLDPELFRAKQREKFAAGTDLVPLP